MDDLAKIEEKLGNSSKYLPILTIFIQLVFLTTLVLFDHGIAEIIITTAVSTALIIACQKMLYPKPKRVYEPFKNLIDKWENLAKRLKINFENMIADLAAIEIVVKKHNESLQEIDGSLMVMQELLKTNIEIFGEITKAVTDSSIEGKDVIKQMTNTMDTLSTTGVQLQNVSEIFDSISSETKVINEIVFKTQLLSFNAFLEAARAGQHGSGFVVVAEEIGSLAKNSGKAAEEISGLLSNSLESVDSILGNTKTGINKVRTTNSNATGIFEKIVSNTSDYLKAITDASEDNLSGVNDAISITSQMRQTLKKTNDMALTTKSLSNTIREDCKELEDSISPFTLLFHEAENLESEAKGNKNLKSFSKKKTPSADDEIIDNTIDKAG
ncbi:MAG: methyl-accepting chemotaxis protein [Oligoflexales bacterium]